MNGLTIYFLQIFTSENIYTLHINLSIIFRQTRTKNPTSIEPVERTSEVLNRGLADAKDIADTLFGASIIAISLSCADTIAVEVDKAKSKMRNATLWRLTRGIAGFNERLRFLYVAERRTQGLWKPGSPLPILFKTGILVVDF